jgi:hypothetical protein
MKVQQEEVADPNKGRVNSLDVFVERICLDG